VKPLRQREDELIGEDYDRAMENPVSNPNPFGRVAPTGRKFPVRQRPAKFDESFPFYSKIKYVPRDTDIKLEPHDYPKTNKVTKHLQRPYFSPKLCSWEVDVVYAPDPLMNYNEVLYLFCINVNTKYLVVYKIDDRNHDASIRPALLNLRKKYYVSNIRGDGEFKPLAEYYSSSPYDNHNRCVDRVIRTIRDAVGHNWNDMRSEQQVQLRVKQYNETPHLGLKLGRMIFSPAEVQADKDLEGLFIRRDIASAADVKERQRKEGFLKYRRGNVIMVHLDFSRTPMRFRKRRRNYNVLAIFLDYVHGNVKCRVLSEYDREPVEPLKTEDPSFTFTEREIVVPVYYTRYVSKDSSSIPEPFKSYFE
jgi:hypothetical protein